MNWLFRNRRTGEITVGQRPNAALTIFLLASVVQLVVRPSGATRTVLTVVTKGALAVWAADELVRGVNPFRRALGATVLGLTLASVRF